MAYRAQRFFSSGTCVPPFNRPWNGAFWPRSKCPIMLADERLKALKRIRLARADVHRTAVDTLRYRGSEPTDAYQLMFQALVGSEGRRESGTANYDFGDLEIGPKLGEGGCRLAEHYTTP